MTLEDQFTAGRLLRHRLSRRNFIATSSLATIGLLASACGGSPPTSQPGSSQTPTGQAQTGETPVKGGTLQMWIADDPPNFDPHQASTYAIVHPLSPCYNLLVRIDPLDVTESRIIPDLATKWDLSADGRQYTFTLRQGVKFHHGKDFKSEDVKASFDRIISPPRGVSSPRQDVFTTVNSIDTPDDYTVVFSLKQPTPSLLLNIAQGFNMILPKDILDAKGDMKKDISGTGPFKFKNHTRAVSFEVERNPNYFVPDRPYLDGIVYNIVPDANSAISGLLSGQLHWVRSSSKGDADQVRQQGGKGFQVAKAHAASSNVFEMNAKRKPWDDVRVRQAVSLAMDRGAALQVLTDGEGVLTGVMHPDGIWRLPEDQLTKIPGYKIDQATRQAAIEKAKQLLSDAGYTSGLRATALVRKGTTFENSAVFSKDQLAKIGIDVALDVNETATFYQKQTARQYDVFAGTFSVGVDDPDATFGQSYLCESERNYSNYCEEQFERLFPQQSQELDLNKRKTLVQQMDSLALSNVLKVQMGRVVYWFMYSSKMRNFVPNGFLYNRYQFQDVWLAK